MSPSFLISDDTDAVKDGYKVISFQPDNWGIDGRVLDFVCRDPNTPNHVSDQALRWHFRQCVLANMRGAGESIPETDFPRGSDRIADLQKEPDGGKLLELEFSQRLAPYKEQEEIL